MSHPQSKLWLEVGWRVSDVDLVSQRTAFLRTRERESGYIRFFSMLLALVEARGAPPSKRYVPTGVNWYNFYKLPPEKAAATLACSFARGGRLRVELYIDTGDTELNKAVFDRLLAERVRIEHAVGETVSWERLDTRRACRLAVYRDGRITAPEKTWPAMADWAANQLQRFRTALDGTFERALAEASEPLP